MQSVIIQKKLFHCFLNLNGNVLLFIYSIFSFVLIYAENYLFVNPCQPQIKCLFIVKHYLSVYNTINNIFHSIQINLT